MAPLHDVGTLPLAEAKARLYGAEFSADLPRAKVPWDRSAPAYGKDKQDNAGNEFNKRLAHLTNPYLVVGPTMKLVTRWVLLLVLVRGMLKRILNRPMLPSIMMVLALAAYNMSPAKPGKGTRPSPIITSYPILGGALSFGASFPRVVQFFIDVVRSANFETVEVPMPGVNMVFVMDLRDREYTLVSHWFDFAKNLDGEEDFNSTQFALPEMLRLAMVNLDGPEWQEQRRIVSVLFSGRAMDETWEEPLTRAGITVKGFLGRAADANKVVNMQVFYQSLIFDLFCDVSFGKHFNTLDYFEATGKEHEFSRAFDFCFGHLFTRTMTPPLVWMWKRLVSYWTGMGLEAEFAKSMNVLNSYMSPMVQEIKTNALKGGGEVEITDGTAPVKFKGVLQIFIEQAIKNKTLHMLEDEYLLSITVLMMAAGRDTTASTLTHMTGHMTPEIRKRMAQELEPFKDRMSFTQSRALALTNAVMNETLRMSPPVPIDQRLSLVDCVLPSGVHVARNTRLMFPNAAYGRDPKLFANPDSFLPDRWMRCDEVTGQPLPVGRMDSVVFPVFFAGPRECMGKDLSRYETCALAAHLWTSFELVPVDPEDKHQWKFAPTMFLINGLRCNVKRV